MQLRRLGASVDQPLRPATRCATRTTSATPRRGCGSSTSPPPGPAERLILSGVVKDKAGRDEALDLGRRADRRPPSISIASRIRRSRSPPPAPRPGLEADFDRLDDRGPPQPPVARARRRAGRAARRRRQSRERAPTDRPPCRAAGRARCPAGPSPTRRSPSYADCGYRFQLERVFGFGREIATVGDGRANRPAPRPAKSGPRAAASSTALLEWSQANDWREPPAELLAEHAASEGLDGSERLRDELRDAVDGVARTRTCSAKGSPGPPPGPGRGAAAARGRGLGAARSIDLLAEGEGQPPLVVDYKTDRLAGSVAGRARGRVRDPALDLRARGRRGLRGAEEVEVAYVFLERPEEPQIETLGADRARPPPASCSARR